MNMFSRRIINKIPGNVIAEPKEEKTGYIGDLCRKTVPQLNELLARQNKLLSNKSFISKLPDKGEKIMKLKETVEEELKKRNAGDILAKMLSGLSMNGKEDLNDMEWIGKLRAEPNEDSDDESDSEQNPLKILANHSGAGFHKKMLKKVTSEPPLIKSSDIATDELETDQLVEEYAKDLCKRFDAASGPKTKFLPNRTLLKPAEPKVPKKMDKRWEVTSATPPLPIHGDTKMVSLHESIKLQADQQQKLKEIQMKHAMERLGAWKQASNGTSKLPVNVGGYREQDSGSSSDEEGSENEVHDEEYPDGGGVVIYNLVDDTND